MAISIDFSDSSGLDLPEPERFVRLLARCAQAIGVEGEAECHLSFISPDEMTGLNEEHMHHEGPTDVLSFAISFEPEFGLEIPRILGEILICPQVAAANAPEHAGGSHNGSLDDEIALLVVHGLLHLSGMDHEVDEEAEAMESREQELLAEFYYGVSR
ncbi:MAG: rRNA maturation RNase YbeY [Actinomycetota bacterium]|nr:rRNA maturation RNase YbeY [Actinomycetota bacterium]